MGFIDKMKGFFDLDQEEEQYQNQVRSENRENKGETPNIVSLHSVQQDAKMVLCEPSEFEEAEEIADHMKKRKSVVVNMQRLDPYSSKRMLDFLSGTVYALNGKIQKLGKQTFLCTPEHVNITGSISEQIEEESEF